mmetsp:Transcript_96046/g.280710  ORF Transcript_96046/g.280710 Transcript_96046/m.280710 type:complete len:87 (-) Transcript_96046:31-291(-)
MQLSHAELPELCVRAFRKARLLAIRWITALAVWLSSSGTRASGPSFNNCLGLGTLLLLHSQQLMQQLMPPSFWIELIPWKRFCRQN